MKNTSLIISIAALVIAVAFGICSLTSNCGKNGKKGGSDADSLAVNSSIAYVNLDRVINEYDMANDLKAIVETKAQNIDAELTRKGKKLESEIATFQDKARKGLLTQAAGEAQQNKLAKQQQAYIEEQQAKQLEIQDEQVVMMRQIYDAVKTYIEKYNEEAQFAFIFANQTAMPDLEGGSIIDLPIVAGSAALDITDQIVKGLNEEYVKTKNGKTEEATEE